MDIRNYFARAGAKKPEKPSTQGKEGKRKAVVIDSDEEDPLPSSNKKRVLASDSDDDIFCVTKNKKHIKKEEPAALPKPTTPKLKPVAPSDFFGTSPLVRKEDRKPSLKRKKSRDSNIDDNSDDDFEKTLEQLDKQQQHASKRPKQETKSPSANETKPKPNENSPPNKDSPKGGLASKLSAKLKESTDIKTIKEEKTTPQKDGGQKDKEKLHSHEKKKKYKAEKHEDIQSPNVKKEKRTPEKDKNVIAEKKEKISPKKEKITPKKEKGNPSDTEALSEVKKKTPKKSETSESEEVGSTPQTEEKKKNSKAAYLKFLQRSGPSNPGSKEIPQGEPDCLQGLVFVLSGVYESLDREEASELIKRHGGKVTTSVSRNTSYLVIGNEAGESKIKKAEQLGTKRLDEDGLLDLIRTRPGKGSNEKTSKEETPSKLKAFAKESKGSTLEKSLVSSPVSKNPASKSAASASKTPSPGRPLSQNTPKSQASCSPSSTSSSPKTQPLSSQELSGKSGETLMWVDKYKPASLKNIIGQQSEKSNVKKLLFWLQNWHKKQSGDKKLQRPSPWAKDDNGAFFKAALLSGPPGVGKTTTAHMVCKEAGFDFIELNASDARSKRTLDEVVSELLSNKTLAGFTKSKGQSSTSAKHALVMDEVDGMSGNEDRGGVQELITLIKKSKIPIITMCNDRNHPKIRSLANHCFDLRFYKPRIEQIRGPMMSICFREGIQIKPDALDQIIIGSNQDIRQILHHLSMWSANEKNLQVDDMKREAQKAKKDMKMGPWDVCKKVFSEADHKTMSLYDKSDLFFHDYSIAPLFVQENYPKAAPHVARGNRRTTLEQLAKTASSLADGDLVEKAIRSKNAWSLLPTQAMFSSVLPGEYMSGHLAGQIEFPRWLGNNSRRNKFDRIMQELQMHMRLKVSGTKLDVGMDYCGPLRNTVINPLIHHGQDGVQDAVKVMTTYDLLREDLESLLELSQWPGSKDPMSRVDSKVKAAFTRLYNKESQPSPYAAVQISKKKGNRGDDMDDEEEMEEDEEDNDVASDAMIKVKKGGQKKVTDASKVKGKGLPSSRGGSGRGRGRGKK
ncbi:replication factor C subunit 1-like [Penaeus chinensis]|uniref:replication factor C subunit 1-like n=1 Tax=Penaeus chinensis TaxID=139456 RepID=UPI001FB6410C|nr:replication factor C subunit 1-like [Penaeus chinensis]